jgi:hypothetical protein
MKNIILPLLVLSALFVACAPKATDTSKIDKQISQYLSLIDARRNPEPQMDQIKALYNTLSEILIQAELKDQADQYLEQATVAEHITPPLQGVEKIFQQALVTLIHNELDSAQITSANIEAAQALYNGLESTAERRGKYFGSDTVFTTLIDDSFKALKHFNDHSDAIQTIYTAINDVYFLSVLYELEGIAAKRGVNDIVVHEKQIEGSIFYDIIRASAKDSDASEVVRTEFAKDGNDIDIDLVKENLKIAFPDKSTIYGNKF